MGNVPSFYQSPKDETTSGIIIVALYSTLFVLCTIGAIILIFTGYLSYGIPMLLCDIPLFITVLAGKDTIIRGKSREFQQNRCRNHIGYLKDLYSDSFDYTPNGSEEMLLIEKKIENAIEDILLSHPNGFTVKEICNATSLSEINVFRFLYYHDKKYQMSGSNTWVKKQ